ncbi:MAG: GGDEF domain-containing protein [Alphaproteobacteria bacterium]|nr:GGDEF domain-containing protein [Alphaproteobacteria bacterium]
MKISDRSPTRAYGAGAAAGARGSAAARTGESGPARGAGDSVEIAGIPAAELTPKVQEALQSLMAEVERLRGELERTQARLSELENIADQDGLLPILNRRAFVRELSRIMSFAERYHVQASMIYFDLDKFKEINDVHGHSAGDEALRAISDLLVRNTRESDVVGRLGGDEFGVILASATLEQANAKAASLTRLISETTIRWEDERFRLTAAHGVYTFEPGQNAAQAIAEADAAMYLSKKSRGGAK